MSHENSRLVIDNECLKVTYIDEPSFSAVFVRVKSPVQTTGIRNLFRAPTSYTRVKRMILPPWTGKFRASRSDCDFLVEGSMTNTLVPRAVVRAECKHPPVWIVNPFDKNLKLRVGQIISKVEELCDPCNVNQIASIDVNIIEDGPQSNSSMQLPYFPSNKSVLMSHKGLFDR